MGSKLLAILSTVILLMGTSCIEIDNPNITTKNYESEVRFVNLSRFLTTTVVIEDINESFGSLDVGNASSYKTIISGARSIKVTYPDSFWVNILDYTDTTLTKYDSLSIDTTITLDVDTTIINDTTMTFDTTYIFTFDTTFFIYDTSNVDTLTMVITTEKKSTIFIVGSTGSTPDVPTNRKYVNAVERYTFDLSHQDIDSSIVRIFNGNPDVEEISVNVTGDSSKFSESTILYAKKTPYHTIFPGDYIISVVDTDTLYSDTLTFVKNKRYTIAVYDTLKTFEDD